jgi:hypothetical protein
VCKAGNDAVVTGFDLAGAKLECVTAHLRQIRYMWVPDDRARMSGRLGQLVGDPDKPKFHASPGRGRPPAQLRASASTLALATHLEHRPLMYIEKELEQYIVSRGNRESTICECVTNTSASVLAVVSRDITYQVRSMSTSRIVFHI